MVPRKSLFLAMVKIRRFGSRLKTALSMENDYELAENVKELSSILVSLYLKG